MNKIIKNSNLFLILFLIILLKEPLYKLYYIKSNIYNTLRCKITEEDYMKLLEFSEIEVNFESDYINSMIIFKDIYNYLDQITIRGGIDKGLKKNPIVYDNTLIGVISKAYKNSSVVQLLTNKDSKISAKINDEIGVLESVNGKLMVKNINVNANVFEGDMIFTSGLGNIKENIFIGKVKNISLDDKNLEKIVSVDYNLNIKNIDYVTIIKESKWFFY